MVFVTRSLTRIETIRLLCEAREDRRKPVRCKIFKQLSEALKEINLEMEYQVIRMPEDVMDGGHETIDDPRQKQDRDAGVHHEVEIWSRHY